MSLKSENITIWQPVEQARLSLDKLTSSNRKRVDRLPEYVNKARAYTFHNNFLP